MKYFLGVSQLHFTSLSPTSRFRAFGLLPVGVRIPQSPQPPIIDPALFMIDPTVCCLCWPDSRDLGTLTGCAKFTSLEMCPRRVPSRYSSTSFSVAMNVMELARKRRISSGAPGNGPVSRSGRLNVVQGEGGPAEFGRSPRLAYSYNTREHS